MALALGSTVHGNTGGAASLAVTLPSANAGDVVIVLAAPNGGPVVSVTSAHLTFAFRGAGGSSPNTIELWWAVASSALTNEVITVTPTSSNFTTVDAFGISGANTSTPFDGSIVTGPNDPLSISTTHDNTFIIGAFRQNTIASPTAGSGWTLISGADYVLSEYQIVSSPQTGLSVSQGSGVGTANGGVADAVVAAAAAGAQPWTPWPQAAPLTAM